MPLAPNLTSGTQKGMWIRISLPTCEADRYVLHWLASIVHLKFAEIVSKEAV